MKILYILTLSVTILSAIAMMRIARNFQFTDGHRFSIMNLEMVQSEGELSKIFQDMREDVRSSVRDHLHMDYFFMVGCYPFVALLCISVARQLDHPWKKLFIALACLQLLPFAFDIAENFLLESWLDGASRTLKFGLFKGFVLAKFSIALGAYLISSLILFYKSIKPIST